MNPLTWPHWLYSRSGWLTVAVAVLVGAATAAALYRYWTTRLLDPAPDEERPLFQCLAVGAYAGLCWPWLLCFGGSLAIGILLWRTRRGAVGAPPQRPRVAASASFRPLPAPMALTFEEVMRRAGRR